MVNLYLYSLVFLCASYKRLNKCTYLKIGSCSSPITVLQLRVGVFHECVSQFLAFYTFQAHIGSTCLMKE